MKQLLLGCLLMYFCEYAHSLELPGPEVYVVTPSPRPPQTDEGRSAPVPFYYHNWMRRMDPPKNGTTTTTQTPDLIFAEFESGNKIKSIRKLLEKERFIPKISTTTRPSTTTARPIYVPDETKSMSEEVRYGLPPPTDVKKEAEKSTTPDMTDYFALYNNMYNVDSAPVYMPSTTSSSTTSTTTSRPLPPPVPNVPVQNIWHIIDSQKYDDYSGKWEEVANEEDKTTEMPQDEQSETEKGAMDDNFALPGFGTNPGNGAENESRAIRTEPNTRFPYVSLKPFQVKTQKKPLLNTISSSKKSNNMYTNLDNFYDIKNPVRGEAQDTVPMVRQPIDRYNPAQPYLPQQSYGSKSKQPSPSVTPLKAVANLVPPPPPPPPRISDGEFPAPTSYESFPPYSPSGPQAAPAPPELTPSVMYQPPVYSSDDSDSDSESDEPPINVDYRYKPPSPPAQPFLPTLPPLTKPSGGYSYDKPLMNAPPEGGYSFDKPSVMPDLSSGDGYSYDKPPMMSDSAPGSGYSYDKPSITDSSPDDDKPDFQGYHYSKPKYPAAPQESPSYGPGPDHSYGNDYPELIYDKPHGTKGGNDMQDMGMAPPPPPAGMKPDVSYGSQADDHGFPQDFHVGDLKFTHDLYDNDHDFHHHHHHTTTTTTTETPRVNRYSYYYLGKKLYYLPLYFSVYFIIYVGALIIKAVLRHKIVYPNSWRPNDQTAGFFSKRSIDFSNEYLHEITGNVTHAIAEAGKKYLSQNKNK